MLVSVRVTSVPSKTLGTVFGAGVDGLAMSRSANCNTEVLSISNRRIAKILKIDGNDVFVFLWRKNTPPSKFQGDEIDETNWIAR
jgi:hypothetical protein